MRVFAAGYSVLAEDAGPWPAILGSIGLLPQPAATASVFVVRDGAVASAEWTGRVERGALLIIEGESSLAEMFGFVREQVQDGVRVSSVLDIHAPMLPLIWKTGLELPRFRVPPAARVFTRDRWSGAPLSAGFRRGTGGVLWVAVPPRAAGYERFPYIPHALMDLGLTPPFRSNRLWAFFDSSYRLRVDLDYFAERWANAGIAALHVAAWHYWEPDAGRDAYVRKLIDACHRRGIVVYAWVELPHVSDAFWDQHPEWREKTALLQDAHLDWRRLMNLFHPGCAEAVREGLRSLASRFDWDGINLAELYFESLEGASNPSRFTPMNDDVRRMYQEARGTDPVKSYGSREFLDFRAGLARRLQEHWLRDVRQMCPTLDVVLTHVDDRLDHGIRDAIGADAGQVLPLMNQQRFTFLVEDPATVWDQGSNRYRQLAGLYKPLAPKPERLAVDINIVERYQDVYPAKQQTGTELLELVHAAADAFPRVALYFEKSLLTQDLPLISTAAAIVRKDEQIGKKRIIDSPYGVAIPWKGGALVDGAPWPVRDDCYLWLPAGAHSVEPGAGLTARVVRFAGSLRSARASATQVDLAYESESRAIAVLEAKPTSITVDGDPVELRTAGERTVLLPRGQHLVTIRID